MRRTTIDSGDNLPMRSRSPDLSSGPLNRNPTVRLPVPLNPSVVTPLSTDIAKQLLFHQQEADRLRRLQAGDGGSNPLLPHQTGSGRRRGTKQHHGFGEWRWIKGSRIGGGSFGEVYKGIEMSSGRLVAGKAIPLPQGEKGDDAINTIKELRKEIKIMKDLRHPNIVRYYRAEVIDKHFYIFMEYVPGGSLRALLDETGPLSVNLAAKFSRFITVGLEYLHDKTVVHRDVKAANVLVDVEGVLKLADFGSAQLFSRVQGLCGTVLWMAPEVIRGQEELIGPKADVWSLGCTLIEMLTAKAPFFEVFNNNTMQVAAFLAGDEPVPLPAEITDPDAIHFLKMCFTRNPRKRPTIGQLRTHPFLLQAEQGPGSVDLEAITTSSARQSTVGGLGVFSAAQRSMMQSNGSKSAGSKAPSASRTSRSTDVVSGRFLAEARNSDGHISPHEESFVRHFLINKALNGEPHHDGGDIAAPADDSEDDRANDPAYPEMSREQVLKSVALEVRNDSEAQVLVHPGHKRRRSRQSLRHTDDCYSMPTTDGGVVTDVPEESLSSTFENSSDFGSDSSGVRSTLSGRVRRQQDAATRVRIPQHIRETVLEEDEDEFKATFCPPSKPCVVTFLVMIILFAAGLTLCAVLTTVTF